MNLSPPPLVPAPADARTRRWIIQIISLLLMIQAIGLLTFSVYNLFRINWELELEDAVLSVHAVEMIIIGVIFVPLAVVECVTAVGFWFVEHGAWLRAMTAQGILLLVCLTNYFFFVHPHSVIYPTMFSCIIIVLYLNTYDVRLTFYAKKSQ